VPEAEIELAADPASVATARRFVADFLRDSGGDDDWTAVQLISELATNAIVHAGTRFVVRVSVAAQTVRIAVTDRNPAVRAVPRHYADDASTGRGLGMIAMMAESWGIDQRPGSKTVWCELIRADVLAGPDDDGGRDQISRSAAPAPSLRVVPKRASPGRSAQNSSGRRAVAA
jgi:anti-sigma regulatory factor (Ser/Thr protein kinase)